MSLLSGKSTESDGRGGGIRTLGLLVPNAEKQSNLLSRCSRFCVVLQFVRRCSALIGPKSDPNHDPLVFDLTPFAGC